MKIEINTRFSTGDEVYVFDKGLHKVRIEDILIYEYSYMYNHSLIYRPRYLCERIEDSCRAKYDEEDLYTKDDLKRMWEVILCDD